MSEKQTIINLVPPRLLYKEVLATAPMACPYCKGSGGFIQDSVFGQFKKECSECMGSGEVMAVVTVEWKPATKEDKA